MTVETKHSLAAGDNTRVRLALCRQTSPLSISYFWHQYILVSEGLLKGVFVELQNRGGHLSQSTLPRHAKSPLPTPGSDSLTSLLPVCC